MAREQNFQNVAWFNDLHTRSLLDMDPPYQRRSVWNDRFREEFIDTILLGYPSPAIFLFETIGEDASPHYAVVDGKQRLTAVLEFIGGVFPVSSKSPIDQLRGIYYDSLPREYKANLLRYRFSVELLPSVNEEEINNIFDRLNRNVKKLSAQELRHAKYDGKFISKAEELSDWLEKQFEAKFPRIAEMSRRQMKDVEIVSTLLLFLEEGAKSYSTGGLDAAFSARDEDWPDSAKFVEEFQEVIRYLAKVVSEENGEEIAQSRLRNQADFYSLFAAVAELMREDSLPEPAVAARELVRFIRLLDFDGEIPKWAIEYLEAARSASNDSKPRRTRIAVVKAVLVGRALGNGDGSP